MRSFVLALVMIMVGGVSGAADFGRTRVEIETAAGRHAFAVELASTAEQLTQGLMFRRTLDAEAGMLFDFGRTQPVAMWMKNTVIPLDMLFIGADGHIIHVAEHAVPGSLEPLGPSQPVRAVLEVNAGTARRLGIRPGDRVRHALFP